MVGKQAALPAASQSQYTNRAPMLSCYTTAVLGAPVGIVSIRLTNEADLIHNHSCDVGFVVDWHDKYAHVWFPSPITPCTKGISYDEVSCTHVILATALVSLVPKSIEMSVGIIKALGKLNIKVDDCDLLYHEDVEE